MFELPQLPYSYDALSPYMSAKTLEYHHDKHHLAYVDNANRIIKDTDLLGKELDLVVKQSYGTNPGLFNNVGQHYNHILFWPCMKKGGGGDKLPGAIQKLVEASFGEYGRLRSEFIQLALAQFGSGWVWLTVDEGKLGLMKTPNGENPLVHGTSFPILGLDVWEHSYYIDYYNDRKKYAETFMDNLVNWDYVLERLEESGSV